MSMPPCGGSTEALRREQDSDYQAAVAASLAADPGRGAEPLPRAPLLVEPAADLQPIVPARIVSPELISGFTDPRDERLPVEFSHAETLLPDFLAAHPGAVDLTTLARLAVSDAPSFSHPDTRWLPQPCPERWC